MTAEQPLREEARLRRRMDPRSGTKANVGPHKNVQPREGEGARHRRRPEYPQETQLDERVSMTYALSPSHIPYRLSIHFLKTKATANPKITPHVSITTSVI